MQNKTWLSNPIEIITLAARELQGDDLGTDEDIDLLVRFIQTHCEEKVFIGWVRMQLSEV